MLRNCNSHPDRIRKEECAPTRRAEQEVDNTVSIPAIAALLSA